MSAVSSRFIVAPSADTARYGNSPEIADLERAVDLEKRRALDHRLAEDFEHRVEAAEVHPDGPGPVGAGIGTTLGVAALEAEGLRQGLGSGPEMGPDPGDVFIRTGAERGRVRGRLHHVGQQTGPFDQ